METGRRPRIQYALDFSSFLNGSKSTLCVETGSGLHNGSLTYTDRLLTYSRSCFQLPLRKNWYFHTNLNRHIRIPLQVLPSSEWFHTINFIQQELKNDNASTMAPGVVGLARSCQKMSNNLKRTSSSCIELRSLRAGRMWHVEVSRSPVVDTWSVTNLSQWIMQWLQRAWIDVFSSSLVIKKERQRQI